MSGESNRQRKGAGKRAEPGAKAPAPEVGFKPPLQPRKQLLIALFVVFVAWVAFLLMLYFKTVYSRRHG